MKTSNTDLKDTFSFGEDKAKNFLVREMGLLSKFKTSFNYLSDKLKPQKLRNDLSKLKWDNGKNYDWALIIDGSAKVIIRQYQNHFTIFCKNELTIVLSDDHKYQDVTYSCFTFNTNREMLSDKEGDARCDNRFLDLNSHLPRLLNVIKENGTHSLWNSYYYGREPFIELKQAFEKESIYSLDLLLFACDELFTKHFEFFAQTETLMVLTNFTKGEVFKKDFHGDVTIDYISKDLKDEYYHNVGISLLSQNGEKKFEDVYSLTRWYFDDVFKV